MQTVQEQISEKFPKATGQQIEKIVSLNLKIRIDLSTWEEENGYNKPGKPNIGGQWGRMFITVLPDGSSHT